MSKRIGSVLLIFMLVAGFVCIALAMEEPDGNARKGKYLFRKNCRSCHKEGAKAVDLSPADKTQAEWQAVFAPDAYKSLQCQAEWEKRSEKDHKDIYTYMYNHAFDSPSPAKCK